MQSNGHYATGYTQKLGEPRFFFVGNMHKSLNQARVVAEACGVRQIKIWRVKEGKETIVYMGLDCKP